MSVVRLYLMRHARTAWNADRRIQGQTDTLLDDHGRAQARGWAGTLAALKVDAVYASDLLRARETAALACAGLSVRRHVDPRLREQDWGDWTGLGRAELRGEHAEAVAAQEALGFGFCPPGGESREELLARVRAALLDAAAAHPGARLLVVTHNGCIRALLHRLLGLGWLPGEPDPIEPYRLHVLHAKDGDLRLVARNEAL